MRMITALGFFAGTLTTISFVPQVYKTWRTRRCDDLSWGMLVLFGGGISSWLVYGLVLSELPIIAANAVTLALILAIASMKLAFSR